MQLQDLIRKLRKSFEEAGLDTAALDARLLVRHHASLSDAELIAQSDLALTAEQVQKIEKDAQCRVKGEPVSRILGVREFYGLNFRITKDTLDPRPDTETLVDAAIDHIKDGPSRILDLGTGTGCILLSMLYNVPEARGVGVDLSKGAIEVARQNADLLGLQDRADFIQGSWFDSLDVEESFDLIVSNPPYIPNLDIPNLAKEVRNHDPILALDGGIDGLDPYKVIVNGAKKHLKPGGKLFLEIGIGQEDDIKRLVKNLDATQDRVIPDLAGIPRVVEISYGEN